MELFIIARQQVDHAMQDQFRETPQTGETAPRIAPRAGIATTTRLCLGAGLRALAAAIEPHQPLTPQPGSSDR